MKNYFLVSDNFPIFAVRLKNESTFYFFYMTTQNLNPVKYFNFTNIMRFFGMGALRSIAVCKHDDEYYLSFSVPNYTGTKLITDEQKFYIKAYTKCSEYTLDHMCIGVGARLLMLIFFMNKVGVLSGKDYLYIHCNTEKNIIHDDDIVCYIMKNNASFFSEDIPVSDLILHNEVKTPMEKSILEYRRANGFPIDLLTPEKTSDLPF